jgi:heparosan-N-sulfate-glucuronate 5-epimerase
MAANNSINLEIGNVSWDAQLGGYYQDFREAVYHFENNSIGVFDDHGIPILIDGDRKYYSVVYIIQYALMQHEFILHNENVEERTKHLENCMHWLDENSEEFKDSIVWRSVDNYHYNLKEGWISAMYQGQAISLYLRAAQLLNNPTYISTAEKIFQFFKYDYSEGGAKRTDGRGYVWLEEYPTEKPSYVLNGFIYALFGVVDLYRVTQNEEAKILYDKCLNTLENNVTKYDRFYWSVYDQLKNELVSSYYQKNVHIPLMEIMFKLTNKTIFEKLYIKWQKQLNSKICKLIVFIMYRIQPRLMKFYK